MIPATTPRGSLLMKLVAIPEYSSADLPSRARAAPAKNLRLSIRKGRSDSRLYLMVLPTFWASRLAISSMFCSTRSASFQTACDLSAGSSPTTHPCRRFHERHRWPSERPIDGFAKNAETRAFPDSPVVSRFTLKVYITYNGELKGFRWVRKVRKRQAILRGNSLTRKELPEEPQSVG